jgi:hypothetical protein
MKVCTKCCEAKLESLFYTVVVKPKNGNNYNYIEARCLECRRSAARVDYIKNAKKRRETSKLYRDNNKEKVSKFNKEYSIKRRSDNSYVESCRLKCKEHYNKNKYKYALYSKERYLLKKEHIQKWSTVYYIKNGDTIKKRAKAYTEELTDAYIIARLKKDIQVLSGKKLTSKQIKKIPSLIKSKRALLKLKRGINKHDKK